MKSRTFGPFALLAVAASTAFFGYRTFQNGPGWFISAIVVVVMCVALLFAFPWWVSRGVEPPKEGEFPWGWNERGLDGYFVSFVRSPDNPKLLRFRLVLKPETLEAWDLRGSEPVLAWQADRTDVEVFQHVASSTPGPGLPSEVVSFCIFGEWWLLHVTDDHFTQVPHEGEVHVGRIVQELEAWRKGMAPGTTD